MSLASHKQVFGYDEDWILNICSDLFYDYFLIAQYILWKKSYKRSFLLVYKTWNHHSFSIQYSTFKLCRSQIVRWVAEDITVISNCFWDTFLFKKQIGNIKRADYDYVIGILIMIQWSHSYNIFSFGFSWPIFPF